MDYDVYPTIVPFKKKFSAFKYFNRKRKGVSTGYSSLASRERFWISAKDSPIGGRLLGPKRPAPPPLPPRPLPHPPRDMGVIY